MSETNEDRHRQYPLPGTESIRNEELEAAAHDLLKAKNKLAQAKAGHVAAYEASKEEMMNQRFEIYCCQDVNFDLILSHRDDEVKLKERKHTE